MSPLFVAHVLGSILVGFAGRKRRVGFLGFLVVSLLVTPIVAAIGLFISASRHDAGAAA